MLRGAVLPARRYPAVELPPLWWAVWGENVRKCQNIHGFRYRERGVWALPVELPPLDDLPALALPVGVYALLCIQCCV